MTRLRPPQRAATAAHLLLGLSLAAASTGCASSSANGDESTLPSAARPVADRDGSATSDRDRGASVCAYEPVHFAYDSDALDSPARDVLQSNARCLQQRDPEGATVVGMTDPRGTEEYNLALGERRALATRRYLTALGVGEQRLSVSSVGEEMATGADEDGYHDDRRSEIRTR